MSTKVAKPSRAAQMAASVGDKLKAAGGLPETKVAKVVPDKETPEQLARRRVLKEKLRSFVEP